MEQLWTQVVETVGPYLPRFGAALAILAVGWIAAIILRGVVKAGLRRTEIDDRLASWLRGDGADSKVDVESWFGRGVYYLIMLFVLVAVLQTLGLTIITEPLNTLLNRVFAFGPQVLGAVVLAAVAWLVATIARTGLTRLLRAAGLDERVSAQEENSGKPISTTIGEAAYWLVFLLFLPGILGSLSLQGMLAPVQALVAKITGFLPNLVTAAVTIAVGWFVAKVTQRIVASLLSAIGTDGFSERVGLAAVLGGQSLSQLVGAIAHFFIFIPVLITAVSTLGLDAVATPISNMLAAFLAAVPKLLGALLVLAVSYVAARLVSRMVEGLLAGLGFNSVLARLDLGKEFDGDDRSAPSKTVGTVVLVAIMLFAGAEAANLLGLHSVSLIVESLIVFGGQILLGLAILGLGVFLSNVAAQTIRATGSSQAAVLATAARVGILVLFVAMGLRQMGIADEIINLAFGLTLGAAAVAVAISFGIGGRDLARRYLDGWSSSLGDRQPTTGHPGSPDAL